LKETLLAAGVPVQGEEDAGSESSLDDIDAEEKEQVLKQIDEIVSKNRIAVDESVFDFTPKKTGAGMPVVINIGAVLLLVGGLFGAYQLFNRQEDSIVTESEAVQSTEGQLLKALKEESDQALSEKDQEIESIQSRLEEARRSQELLEAETAQKIQDREAALREEMAQALEEERRRLQEQGVAAEEIERRLREYEENKNRELQEQIAAARAEFEAEQAEQQQAMQAVIAEYQSTLEQAEEERRNLEADLKAREAELEQEFLVRQDSLEEDKARIAAELELLGRRQEQEGLVMDQILSMYARINENIRSGDYDTALDNLDSLSGYLAQDSVASLEVVRERRSIENFLISSLRKLIESERGREEIDTGSLIASANRLADASALVESANRLYSEGLVDEARAEYERALTLIPDLRAGYERLHEIESDLIEAERTRLEEVIDRGDERYRTEAYEESLDIYREALSFLEDDSERLKEMLNNVIDAGYRLGSEAEKKRTEPIQAELERRTRELESQLADLRARQEELLNRQEALLTEQRELQNRQAELTATNTELNSENTELEQQARNVSVMNETLRSERQKLGEEYATLDRERKDLEGRLEIFRARARELEAERESLLSQIDSISKLYLNEAGSGAAIDGSGADEDTVMALLQTKLLVKEILASDAVKSQYPDLYDAMDEYFEVYGEQKERAGKAGLMQEIIALTGYLSEGRDPEEIAALLEQKNDAEMQTLLLEFLGD